MKYCWTVLLNCFFLTVFASGVITNSQADLAQKLSGLQSFSADITQTMGSDSGESMVSFGHLWVKNPGKFRYEIASPNAQIFVSDGQKLYDYEPDLMQVVIRPLDQALSETPLLLLSGGTESLEKLFSVQETIQGQFILTPLDSDNLISQINLSFKNNLPISMEVINSFGQATQIGFSNVIENKPMSESQFKFTIPNGVDVLGS